MTLLQLSAAADDGLFRPGVAVVVSVLLAVSLCCAIIMLYVRAYVVRVRPRATYSIDTADVSIASVATT